MNSLELYIKPGTINIVDIDRILDGEEMRIENGMDVFEFIPEDVLKSGQMTEMKRCQFNINGEYQTMLSTEDVLEFRDLTRNAKKTILDQYELKHKMNHMQCKVFKSYLYHEEKIDYQSMLVGDYGKDGKELVLFNIPMSKAKAIQDIQDSFVEPKQILPEDEIFSNFQALKDYCSKLKEKYPNFVTMHGVSMKNSSLYSNYMMADKDLSEIKYLHVTHDGRQEWSVVSPDTARQRLENAYFPQLVKEWGLNNINPHDAELKSIANDAQPGKTLEDAVSAVRKSPRSSQDVSF